MNLLVISHQRSGTHLTIDSIINNFDYFNEEFAPLNQICHDKISEEKIKTIQQKIQEGGYVIKAHFLPDLDKHCSDNNIIQFVDKVFKESKKIYIVRNGLDVVVSSYFYAKKFRSEIRDMSFKEFLDYEGWPPVSLGMDKLSFWAYHVDQ
jgi:hypothetical protein